MHMIIPPYYHRRADDFAISLGGHLILQPVNLKSWNKNRDIPSPSEIHFQLTSFRHMYLNQNNRRSPDSIRR